MNILTLHNGKHDLEMSANILEQEILRSYLRLRSVDRAVGMALDNFLGDPMGDGIDYEIEGAEGFRRNEGYVLCSRHPRTTFKDEAWYYGRGDLLERLAAGETIIWRHL